jgi:hypothetical protein
MQKNKIKNFPRIFPYQLIHDDDLKSMRDGSFERGHRAGKRDAIDSLRSIQAYDCKTLTEAERTMVMNFLIENNLEFGYDVSSGGFYVLKLNSPAFSINQEEFNRKAQHILDTVVKPQVEKYEQLKNKQLFNSKL